MRSRATAAGLGAIVALGAALRFIGLGGQGFWFDEAATYAILREDFAGMIDTVPESEQTPHLYYVLGWVWARVFGFSEAGIRSLSALVGTLTIIVVYAAARRLLGPRAAIGAAALAATSPVLVWFSQEARAYALVVLLASAALLFFARALETGSRRDVLAWAACSALAVLTHYFAVFAIVVQAAWMLRRRGLRRPVALVSVPLGLLILALIPLAEYQSCHEGGFGYASMPSRAVRAVKQSFASPSIEDSLAEALLLLGMGAGLALLVASLAVGRRRLPRAALLAAGVGLATVAIPVVAALVKDVVNTRNLLVAWAPLAIALVAGLCVPGASARLARLGVATLAVVGIASAIVVASDERWQRDNWRGIAEDVPQTQRMLVITPEWGLMPMLPYFDGVQRVAEPFVETREVVVAALGVRGEIRTPPPLAPGDPAPPPPAPGFRLVERVDRRSHVVLRYVAPRPVRVSTDTLRGLALSDREGVMLVDQRPSEPSDEVSLSCDRFLV